MAISTIGTNSLSDPIAVNATGALTGTVNGLTPQASNMQPFNRIINGAMAIDQRNAGAAVTITNTAGFTFGPDRWGAICTNASKFSMQQNAGSVTPPAGYPNYLGFTSLAATSLAAGDYYFVNQVVEGLNMSDLAWGTANAQTVTISFWVRSSLTGTFGGALTNGSWSYPFSFAISSADTWEQKTVTIAGSTSGTWATNNTLGMRVQFSLGSGSTFSGTAGSWQNANLITATGATSVVGTSGATFYITGVQLEAGSTASSFAHENYADTLSKCQRYYEMVITGEIPEGGNYYASWRYLTPSRFSVTKRANPTLVVTSQAGWPNGGGGTYSITGDTQQASIIGQSGNALNNQLHNYIFTANAEL